MNIIRTVDLLNRVFGKEELRIENENGRDT